MKNGEQILSFKGRPPSLSAKKKKKKKKKKTTTKKPQKTLHPWLSKMRPEKILNAQAVRIFAECTCPKVRFLTLRLLCCRYSFKLPRPRLGESNEYPHLYNAYYNCTAYDRTVQYILACSG